MTHVQTETFNDGTTGTGDGIIAGIEFNKDGTKMFTSFGFDLVDPADDYHYLNEYNLSTPYDISTRTYAGNNERCELGTGGNGHSGNQAHDLEFSNDGMKLFTSDKNTLWL